MKRLIKIKRQRNNEKIKNKIKLKRSLINSFEKSFYGRMMMNFMAMNHCM